MGSPDEPTREELLIAARIMADMIYGEWSASLPEAGSIWGPASTPEQRKALEKLDAYLGGQHYDEP